MRLTALDIREQQFRRVMRGFDPDEVVTFLTSVATEYEQLVSENRDLRQRLLDLEHQIAEFQNMEKALRDTLLTAERVTVEARENAQKEAGLILREAEVAAQHATAGISAEILQKRRELSELQQRKKDYLFGVRALAQSHLQMVDSAAAAIEAEEAQVPRQASGTGSVQETLESATPSQVATSFPLPSEVGGVIPSAVAPPGEAPGQSPRQQVASAASSGTPASRPADPAGSSMGGEAPSKAFSGSDWAEASFEPGDLVPRGAARSTVSQREAEHYRRGIAPDDPLPSLLRTSGADAGGDPGVQANAGNPSPLSAADRDMLANNPAHTVGPDGSQGN